jgi:hypothetical protein
MNAIDLLIAARSAECGRAQRRRVLRHVHLEAKPIAIAAMQMSIESHGIWGALVGTTHESPTLIVAPEPRTPGIAFGAMAKLAKIICDAVDAAANSPRDHFQTKKGAHYTRVRNAPQLLVANEAVVALLDRVGRRMRPAGYGGHVVVPPEVNVAGAHLGFYAQQARRAGSSLSIVATRELAQHFVTGQSSFEDSHLGAQLAWFDPGLLRQIAPDRVAGIDLESLHGAEAAALIETTPMSVLTDPQIDNGPLIDAVARFNTARAGSVDSKLIEELSTEVRSLLRPCLEPTWEALWIAHEILGGLSEAPSVSQRWQDDLDSFTRHADYIARGGRRASLDSPRRAAMVLEDWEGAQARYDATQVLEDEYALLGAISEGQAIVGDVVAVDTTNRELGPSGKAMTARPLVTLAIEWPCPFPVDTELWWTERQKLRVLVQSAVSTSAGGATVVLKVVEGMRGDLPAPGDRACFSVFHASGSGWGFSAPLPRTTPWTHTPSSRARTDDGSELDTGPALDTLVDVTQTVAPETTAV